MYRLFSFCFQALMGEYFLYTIFGRFMEKFKANDNKNEEHEIKHDASSQFNKSWNFWKQILSLISDINQAWMRKKSRF